MLLEPGLALAFLFRIHGFEKGMGAAKHAPGLEIGHAGQARHGIQPNTPFLGFLGACRELRSSGISDHAHPSILSSSRQGGGWAAQA